jgi:microcystin-dependent protein
LQINQYQALYSLIGTAYGGDGRATFALPDLRGRTIRGVAAPVDRGKTGGSATVTLTIPQMPAHTHSFNVDTAAGTVGAIAGHYVSTCGKSPKVPPQNLYAAPTATGLTALNSGSISSAEGGGSEPHNNMQPYLVLVYCIAFNGVYPSKG